MAQNNTTVEICTTPACVHMASHILRGLATNYTEIDPCTDFAEYTCGNWKAWNQIPAGQSFTDTLTSTHDQIYYTVRQILESPYPSCSSTSWIAINFTEEQAASDKRNFDKLQSAYNICLNNTFDDGKGLKRLSSFVQDVVDAFPTSLDSDKSTAIGRTLAIFETYGISTTQRMLQIQNNLDPDEAIVNIMLPLGAETLPEDEELATTYTQLAAELVSSIHPMNLSTERAFDLVRSAFKVQTQINSFMLDAQIEEAEMFAGVPVDALTPRTSLAEIQDDFPELGYRHVFEQLAPSGFEAARVAAPAPSYFRNLTRLVTTTPSDVLQTFFVWKAIYNLSPYVNSGTTTPWNEFYNNLIGAPSREPVSRWHECVSFVDVGPDWTANSPVAVYIGPSGLTWILSRFFADNNYAPEARNLATLLAEYLEHAFMERIKTRDWLSPNVKQSAFEKLQAMRYRVGFPTDPDAMDPIAMENFYADVNITPTHLENALALAKLQIEKKWASLGKPWRRGQFRISSLVSSAYQDWQLNAVTLSAGIQQFPIFNVDFPSYLLFGGLGSVIGHEITHGFDANGHHYDAAGNLSSWWDESSAESFANITACFISQYDNFTITGPDGRPMAINGAQTLGENLADAGGVATSFTAWKRWEETRGRGQSLPGLEQFSHEQLFFIKWGQFFCRNSPAAVDVELALVETHAPNDARIMLPLENSVFFKEAFKCPVREPVCEMW